MRIGIDLGGNHIGVGLIDEKGNIILKKEKDILKQEKQNIGKIITTTIKSNIEDMLKEKKININEIEYIGIAFPAALKNGKVGLAVNLQIIGEDVQKYLKEYFKIPVYIKNDAKCASLCEKKFGGLKPYKNAIFLGIGTGVGGAVFINNELLTTKENDTFEVGHMIIAKEGIECKCGRKGCFEKYASMRALKDKIIAKYSLQGEMTGLQLHNFIIENQESKKMQKILEEYINNLSLGISNLINLFEPEAISIGGSFAYYGDIFLERLRENLQEKTKTFSDSYPSILLATYKNDAGIIGASMIE